MGQSIRWLVSVLVCLLVVGRLVIPNWGTGVNEEKASWGHPDGSVSQLVIWLVVGWLVIPDVSVSYLVS